MDSESSPKTLPPPPSKFFLDKYGIKILSVETLFAYFDSENVEFNMSMYKCLIVS